MQISNIHLNDGVYKNSQANTDNTPDDEINIDDISILYTTELTEEERNTFNDTYKSVNVNDNEQGKKFLEGLKSNKESLCKELGLSSDEYDSFACIALAIASQETGMGQEKGYNDENTGIGKFFRSIFKQVDVLFGGASASSGLTQMKIYDFLNTDKLSQSQKDIINSHGIEASSVSDNNLYQEPDKAAVATMVVLTSIASNYENYLNVLDNGHKDSAKNLPSDMSDSQITQKGNDILNNISDIYHNADDKEKIEIRSAFKQLLLSSNGSKISDKGDMEYNEEYQLNELNKLLSEYGDFNLNISDIDYLRYVLTAPGEEMNITEYCAYGWNKGTAGTGMQLDRLLADKIGVILSNPEDFDYDQFTVNVSSLAAKYAQQAAGKNGIDIVNENIKNSIDIDNA